MAEINLLQNQLKGDSNLRLKKYIGLTHGLLFSVLILAILASLGLYVWNKLSVKSEKEALSKVEQRKVDLEANLTEKRNSVVRAQARLTHLNTLLDGKVYWTNFLTLINSAAISSVQFRQLDGADEGTAVISGTVPDLPTLALLTQRLNELEGVSQVVLNSSALSESTLKPSYSFTLTLFFNPEILKFKTQ